MKWTRWRAACRERGRRWRATFTRDCSAAGSSDPRLPVSCVCSLVEIVLTQPYVKLRARQTQTPRRLRLVATGVAHDARDHVALHGVQIARRRDGCRRLTAQRQMTGRDQAAFAQDRRALERVAQLAHVARPVV